MILEMEFEEEVLKHKYIYNIYKKYDVVVTSPRI